MSSGKNNGGARRSVFGSIRNAFSSKKDSDRRFSGSQDSKAGGPPPPTYDVAVSQPATSPGPSSPSTSGYNAPARGFLSPYQAQLNANSDVTNDSLTSLDDPYAFLARYDTMFLVDDSGSMSGGRWREVKTVLNQIVPVCAVHDKDGIDIEFLNSDASFNNVTDPAVVDDIFRRVFPTAATPTGRRVHEILDPYVSRFESLVREGCHPRNTGMKPLNLIVITDGEPNDVREFDLATVLERIARRLDEIEAPLTQLGVQFFQVGRDASAARALANLDDNLGGKVKRGALRDIVDTVTFNMNDGETSVLTSEAVLKTLLGAVTRKYDRQILRDQRTT